MRLTKLRALLLVPVLVLLIAAAPALVNPPPIAVPAGLSEQAVAKAIRVGMAQRGWVLTRQDPGYVEATLHLRTHMARIGITFDTQSIGIKYLESANLDYEVKKGVERIHRNYLKWIDNVVQDINVQLQGAVAER